MMRFTQFKYINNLSYSLKLISIYFFIYPSFSNAQLIINEVVSCNNYGLPDRFGEFPDWIEIYNYSESKIDLSQYYLSDKPSSPQKWQFPKIELSGKTHLVLFASGKDENTAEELHTNFKINADGETILLSKEDSIINQLKIPAMACNHSYGYLSGYEDSLLVFIQSTPGYPNTNATIPVLFSHHSGFYKDSFALTMSTPEEAEIRYTINNALVPNLLSNLYTSPLNIKSRVGDQNIFSEIPTSDTTFWKKPSEEVFKINIVRAAAFLNGQQVSKVYTKSYGITPSGHQRYTFPIVSLVTKPSNFFGDSTGIYVVGTRKLKYWEFQLPNFDNDWEREVFVEFFESNGEKVISQQAEIEIAGQSTRWRRQKSLKLKASGKGNKNRFEYDFFKSGRRKYRTLVLRSPFADYRKSFIKDELINHLAEKTGLPDADCQPVIVFLNGEYWGIHILQEKQDKYYLEDYYGVDKDSIHILHGNATLNFEIIEGSGKEYLELRDYAVQHSLNEPQHYSYISEHINIDNFINYYCFHMAAATRDWPWNNIKYWRPMDNSRKWEWIPFDFDSAYNYPETDMFQLASEPDNESVEWSVLLYNNLMENDQFKNKLLIRLEELLNNQFCTDSILLLVDQYKKKYAPEIEEHMLRWSFEEDYSWEDEITVYNTFPQILSKTLKRIANEKFEWDLMVCDTLITLVHPHNQENKTMFSFHPNPATNYLHIQFQNHKEKEHLYISDITGTHVLKLGAAQNFSNSIDISSLSAGIYYIYNLNKINTVSGKLIKLNN